MVTFLTSMKDAKVENERIRKQKEEDDKRAALEAKVMNGFNDITIQDSWLLYNSWQTMIVIVKKPLLFPINKTQPNIW